MLLDIGMCTRPSTAWSIVEVARCCASQVSFSIARKSQDRRALRKNHIAVSPLHTVPKLTLVLSCRGYHLPDLIRERNAGKNPEACSLPLSLSVLLRLHSASKSKSSTKTKETKYQPFSPHSSPTPSPPSPPSSPRNGTPLASPPTATPSQQSTAPRPPPSKPTSATSPPATSKPPTTRTCKATCGKTGTRAARTPRTCSRMLSRV